jgi:hypothetical protein
VKKPGKLAATAGAKPHQRAEAGGAPKKAAKGKDGNKGQSKAEAKAKVKPGKNAPLREAEPAVPARIELVRDSFTMPSDEFALIATLKARALQFQRPTKKSELLRAGLQQLAALNDARLRAALDALRQLPTGRPKKAR